MFSTNPMSPYQLQEPTCSALRNAKEVAGQLTPEAWKTPTYLEQLCTSGRKHVAKKMAGKNVDQDAANCEAAHPNQCLRHHGQTNLHLPLDALLPKTQKHLDLTAEAKWKLCDQCLNAEMLT